LNEAQTQKLRQLSFLTLAKNPADLSYANLQQALGLSNGRELEDLVISAIYAGLITGTLDPYHQLVTVSSVAPLRDLAPNSIPSMLSTLNEWSVRCVSTLADLEKQIASIKAEAVKRHKDETEWAAQVEKLLDTKHTKEQSEEPSKGGHKLGGLGKLLSSGAAAKRGSGGLDGEHYSD
jgi:COP9 signalosome complex subunit 7